MPLTCSRPDLLKPSSPLVPLDAFCILSWALLLDLSALWMPVVSVPAAHNWGSGLSALPSPAAGTGPSEGPESLPNDSEWNMCMEAFLLKMARCRPVGAPSGEAEPWEKVTGGACGQLQPQ